MPELPTVDAAAIDAIVKDVMLKGPQPGVVISLTGPRGNYNKAYGFGKIAEPKTPMNLSGHIRIGSITKLITAIAVFQQMDAGKLTLYNKLSEFVDEVPSGDKITIEHMMSMRSGLFEYTQDPNWQNKSYSQPNQEYTQDEVLSLVRANQSRFTPGTKYDYADSNWVLLGMVLEKITGKAHETIIQNVIEDLGLKQTSYPLGNASEGNEVPTPIIYGYRPNIVGSVWSTVPPQDVTLQNPEMFGAAGGVISTVNDLQILGQKIRDGALLSLATRTLRDTVQFPVDWQYEGPPTFGYGLGNTFFGRWRGHGSSIPGYTCVCMYDSESGAVIAAAENFQTPDALVFTKIFYRIANYLYPESVN